MLAQIRKRTQRFLGDQRGSVYIEFLVTFVITITVVATLISFFDITVKRTQAITIAQRVARSIEVTGIRDTDTSALFLHLCSIAGISGASYDVVDISPPYLSGGRIQLRSRFTVIVRVPMQFKVAQPGGTPISIPFTIVTKAAGMSEVFFK